MAGELSNRSAQGQAFCNMGFAQSQLGEYHKSGKSFMHAIQAAKDSGDKKSLWQAYEGFAAVSFLEKDYNKAVEYYKLALSVLSTTGEADGEHNDRIVSKLADALECQLVLSNKLNGRLPPLRVGSVKSDHPVEKREGKQKRVGKTRSRQEHHKLIARGIDGDQTPEESEESTDGVSQESSDGEERQPEESGRERKHKKGVITTEAEVHQERTPSQRAQNTTSTDSSQEEQIVKERERQGKRPRHTRKTKSVLARETVKSTGGDHYYEQPVDEVDNTRATSASPAKSSYSDDMPRAHREAYLASVQASTASMKTPNGTEVRNQDAVQSRTCVVQ